MVQNGQNSQNGQDCQKWSKRSKMVHIGKNGQTQSKMVGRARHTSLSAQRARRTKSTGPKGLQLEIGPGGAPKLPVPHTEAYPQFFAGSFASMPFLA